MNITINATQLATVAAFIAGVCTTAAFLWVRLVKPAREAFGQFAEFREDWNGIPDRPGVPGRSGMMVRMAGLEARQAGVEAELRTNGGSTVKDAVRATQAAVAAIQAQLDGAHVIALPSPVAPPQPAAGPSESNSEAA